MFSAKAILTQIGFTAVPQVLESQYPDIEECSLWFRLIDFDEAVCFYGLNSHPLFMEKFRAYQAVIDKNELLQAAVFVLNRFLLANDDFIWNEKLERPNVDMFVAFVLLSGYQIHQTNMMEHGFDEQQIVKHKHRIYESCTIGFDTYHLEGIDPPQLKWGSHFIQGNIIELGRLQFERKAVDSCLKGLVKGEYYINIHIPRGGKLSQRAVDESLNMAKEKVLSCFADISAETNFLVRSWLLAKGLDAYLSAESNIRLFRNRFDVIKYLDCASISKFLFDCEANMPIENYPENTSLRKTVKEALLRGECFYDGIGVLKNG